MTKKLNNYWHCTNRTHHICTYKFEQFTNNGLQFLSKQDNFFSRHPKRAHKQFSLLFFSTLTYTCAKIQPSSVIRSTSNPIIFSSDTISQPPIAEAETSNSTQIKQTITQTPRIHQKKKAHDQLADLHHWLSRRVAAGLRPPKTNGSCFCEMLLPDARGVHLGNAVL